MKDTAFIKAAFGLPLVCPALAWTALVCTDGLDGAPAALKNLVAIVALTAFPSFSVPYAGFAAVAVALSWCRSVRAHLALGVVSPPLFGAVLILLSAWTRYQANAAYARAGLSPEERSFSDHLFWMEPALLWGYAYVALALVLRAAAKNLRLIAP